MPPDIVALRQVVYKLKNEVKHGEKGEGEEVQVFCMACQKVMPLSCD